ncbi:MAG TPA: ABC transporter permease [Methanothrix sp.]|nr:ABC transporter permease [Methanothrix sp.]
MRAGIISDFELSVVNRHIAHRRRGTILSVAAVALAVAISITFVSMQEGFQGMLFDIIVEDLPHITVSSQEGDDYIYLYRSLMEDIWAIPGVAAVSPGLATSATFSYKDNLESVQISGINPIDIDKIYNIAKYVYQGDLASIQDGKRVVIGDKLAERLNVKVGQTVYASFPDAKSTSLVVSGIFSLPTGWPEDIAFVSISTAQDFLGDGDVLTGIDVKLEDVYSAEAVAAELQGQGYKADSWQTLYPDILKTLAIEKFQNNLIMLLIMIIAAFGIGSVMYMLVNEKTAEIGMFMAIGARGGSIRNIFLLESGILGLMGGVVGAIFGLAVSLYLQSLEIKMNAPGGQAITLPIVINPESYLAIVAVAVGLSLIAGLYPARKASRLDPAIAING